MASSKILPKPIEKGEKKQKQILAALEPLKEKGKINSDHQFFVAIDKALPFKLNKGQIKMLVVLGEKDEEAQEVFDNPLEENDQTGAVHTWEVKPLYDSDLRDTDIPWKQDVDDHLPFAPDAWMDREKDKIGYEIPFTKYFYEYTPLRDLDMIMADINALEEETEDLLEEIKEG